MKKVRTYNWHCDGSDSHINIYFEDGTYFCRTVSCADAIRLCKEGEAAIPYLMEKYAEPQKREYVPRFDDADEERYFMLLAKKEVCPLSGNEEEFLLNYTPF